jgi:hypothetical protein
MPLPWVRIDTNLPTHDKILWLVENYRRDGLATAFVYVSGITWAGLNGTDGVITTVALPFIHGTKKDAERLVEASLWMPHARGWCMPNYLARNEAADVSDAKAAAQVQSARKAACARWHGKGCNCWQQEAQ